MSMDLIPPRILAAQSILAFDHKRQSAVRACPFAATVLLTCLDDTDARIDAETGRAIVRLSAPPIAHIDGGDRTDEHLNRLQKRGEMTGRLNATCEERPRHVGATP